MNVFHFPFSVLVYLLMLFFHILFSYLLSTKSAQNFQNFIFFSQVRETSFNHIKVSFTVKILKRRRDTVERMFRETCTEEQKVS